MQNLKKVLKAFVKTKLKKSDHKEQKADKKHGDKKAAAKKPVPAKVTAAKHAPTKAKTSAKPAASKKPAAPAKNLKAAKGAAPKKAAAAKAPVPAKKAAPAKPVAPKTAKPLEVKKDAPLAKAKNPEKAAVPAKILKKAEPQAPTLKAPKTPKKPVEMEVETEEIQVETKRDYSDEEVILTDAEGRRYCRVKDCDQIANVDAYCRYHYLLFWKKIQVRKKILTEGKLERYVEELTARYPDKYLEMLRKDLRSEKDFLSAIQELELDDTSGDNDLEDEAQSYIEEVRGMSTEGGTSSRDDDEF